VTFLASRALAFGVWLENVALRCAARGSPTRHAKSARRGSRACGARKGLFSLLTIGRPAKAGLEHRGFSCRVLSAENSSRKAGP
jgi:hypothetical protein